MRKIFALFGTVGVQGMSGVKKELSGLDAAIKKAAKEMNKAGRQFQKAGKELIKNITVPVIAATAAVGALAIKTGQYADKLLDLEQITGLSSDKLQEFEHVARVAGVSFDGLVGIISKFTNQLPEIEAGGTAASRAFSKLGVSIRDNSGNVRSMNDLFPEILNKLQGIENVTERNAIAQDVFGRSLTDLAPVLGMTSDKLNSVMQEARDMGLVMSKEDINAANNLRIEMEKVRAQFAAVSREIAASFVPILRDTIAPMVKTTIVPALQDMADRLRKIIAWFGKLSPKTQQMAVKMTIMSAAIGPLLFGLGSMLRSFYSLRLAVLALNAALTANPFGVALVAISALTLGAVSLYNSLKNVNAEKEKQNRLFKEGVEAKYNERVAGALEEVIYFYDKLSKMDKVVIEKEEYDQAVKSIDNLEETLGDAGIAFEGSFGRKAELARQKLKDFTAEAKTAANNIDTSSPSSSGTNIRVSADPDQVAKDEDTIYKLVSQTMDKIRAKRERQARNTKEILEKEKIWRENEADYQAEVAEETARKKEQIEQQYQRSTVRTFRERLAVVKDAYRAEIAAAEEAGAETANIHKYYARQIADIYVDQANSIISNVSMVADQMYDIFNQMARNEEINIDNWSKQQIAAVENSVLSEEEKAKKMEQIDAQTEKKKKDLRKKQANADKAMAIFNIGINAAQAIMKAWADLGFPAALPLSILIGALAAVQIALVAAQPIPLAEGGLARKKQGGIPATIAEGGQDELILPMSTGVRMLSESLTDNIAKTFAATGGARVAAAPVSGSSPAASFNRPDKHYHVHTRTLIADRAGLKWLFREFKEIEVSEATRVGAIA